MQNYFMFQTGERYENGMKGKHYLLGRNGRKMPIFKGIGNKDLTTNEKENNMEYQVGQEVVSTDDVVGVTIGTIGVITEIIRKDELYGIIFKGGLLRFLYPSEFKLK